jgi:hypothetical protein
MKINPPEHQIGAPLIGASARVIRRFGEVKLFVFLAIIGIAIFSQALPVNAATLGYWRFENSSNLGLDSSGNNVTLSSTGVGSYTIPVSGTCSGFFDPMPLTQEDNFRAAQCFNAAVSNANCLSASDPWPGGFSDFTIEAMVTIKSLWYGPARVNPIVSQGAWAPTNNGWELAVSGSDNTLIGKRLLHLQMSQTGSNIVVLNSNIPLLDNKDYYVAASVHFSGSNTTAIFYSKNLTDGGAMVSSTVVSSTIKSLYNSSSNFYIGRGGTTSGFLSWNGHIDEVRLSDRVLAPTELLENASIVTGTAGPNWIEQWGIRWTFDKDISRSGSANTYQYGTYCNGDFWIKGPVNIVGITPPSALVALRQTLNANGALYADHYAENTIVNGSMVNPSALVATHSYDSWSMGYSGTGNINYPIISIANPYLVNSSGTSIHSIISSVSLDVPWYDGGKTHIKAASVLTVVGSVPSADAFRPPYSGSNKYGEIRASSINLAATPLGNLPPVAGRPWTCPAGMSPLDWATTITERVWLNHTPAYWASETLPKDNVNPFWTNYVSYSRDFARWISNAALVLNTDVGADKKKLMYHMIQRGIDIYGVVRENPDFLTNDGGGQSGRVLPLAIAAHLLNHTGMKDVLARGGSYRYTQIDSKGRPFWPTRPTPGYVHFGELDQIHYVTKEDVDITANTYQIRVTGTGLSPNIAGVYTRGVDINAKPAYYRTSDATGTARVSGFADGPVLYYDNTSGWQVYQTAPYSATNSRWIRTSGTADPFGTFAPSLASTGTATVAAQTTSSMAASPWRPDLRTNVPLPYLQADIGVPDWGIRNSTFPCLSDKAWDSNYRVTVGITTPATALTAHIMGMKTLFNHPAYFDYADRWVRLSGFGTDAWTAAMWNTYRANYGPVYSGP